MRELVLHPKVHPENLHREADPISGPGVYTSSTLRRWYFVHADRMRFDHAEVPPPYRRIKRSCSAIFTNFAVNQPGGSKYSSSRDFLTVGVKD